MTERRNPLDGTPGTTVTAGNGGGDAWSTVVGGAMVYVASPTWSGPAAAVASTDTAGYLLRQVQNTGPVRAVGYVRVPVRLAATADVVLCRAYTAGGSSVVGAGVLLRGAGSAAPCLVLQTRGSGGYVERWTSATVPWDTWLRVELDTDPGTSPTTGSARLRWYLADSPVPTGDSGLVAGIDTAGTAGGYSDVRHGTVAGVVIDHVGVRDGTDAADAAPWPSNTAPTVTLPAAATVAAGTGWSLTAVAADDGAVVSHAWDVQRLDRTGTTAVSQGLTGTTGPTLAGDGTTTVPGSVLQVTCTVTDDGGLTGTSTTEVRVPTTGPGTVLATDGTGDPGWTVVGDAPSTGAALGDDDPTTKVLSPQVTTAVSTTRTWRLTPTMPREQVRLVAGQVTPTVPSGDQVTVELLRGTTVLATQTTTPTAPADVVLTVADALTTVGTDPPAWSDLSVRVTVQGT